MGFVDQLAISKDGKYLATVSSGEGHTLLDVFVIPDNLYNNINGKMVWKEVFGVDPYPGGIRIQGWEGSNLIRPS